MTGLPTSMPPLYIPAMIKATLQGLIYVSKILFILRYHKTKMMKCIFTTELLVCKCLTLKDEVELCHYICDSGNQILLLNQTTEHSNRQSYLLFKCFSLQWIFLKVQSCDN